MSDDLATARKLAALPWWRWEPGMLALMGDDKRPDRHPLRIVVVTDDTITAACTSCQTLHEYEIEDGVPRTWVPALGDYATAGWLLAFLADQDSVAVVTAPWLQDDTDWLGWYCAERLVELGGERE